ncbi:rRNA maturation RNase YbeY [Candidatus Weimeria sp. HCP3S3_B5]|uniref:rRNA maturation RNase YbeY n=1 Tax=Candidatus Weimeria sp. HCP3S3_B5 TaxID=3438871 RepID=UPI002A932136|nr:rRNA maturation RNase YbeY [Lachnospiraceae bacterium]MDY6352691.1 rRNA maturation RNase YbeY [Lachnospiraceae bacterium]
MTLLIDDLVTDGLDSDYKELAESVISETLDLLSFPYPVQVSLSLVSEEEIHVENKEFRNVDRVTDVLSFPMLTFPAPGDFSFIDECDDIRDPDTGEVVLGDIVLCTRKVIDQAAEFGHPVRREYAFLIAHSMLHLLGYDHVRSDEAKEMERLEDQILNGLGIGRD